MCGRLAKTKDERDFEIRELVDVSRIFADLRPRYNIAPSQPIPVLRHADDHQNEIVDVRWGFVPHWMKDITKSPRPINAKSETVAEKPYFRDSFKHRRCCILADGYYEWKSVGSEKQPFFIHLRDKSLFFVAGLWDCRQDEPSLETGVVLTTQANSLCNEIHDRMPVIFTRETAAQWLNPHATRNDLLQLLTPFSPDKMEMYSVSKFVSRAGNEGPQCIEPFASS